METAVAAVSASTGALALKTLLPKLTDMLISSGDQGSSSRSSVKGIEHLERELASMRAALEKVSESPPEQLDGQVRLWVRDVRDMAYDIEDAIDPYMVREAAAAATRPGCQLTMPFAARRHRCRRGALAAEIERIKKEVEEVSRRRERYEVDRFINVAAPLAHQPVDRRLPALYTNAASLVGVDGPSQELIKLLAVEGEDVSSRQKLKLVSIVGPGGIGKTTLANLVYQKLQGQFECRAFVSVSLRPNIKAVLSSILCQVSQFKYENFSSWGEKEIIDKIRDLLKNNRRSAKFLRLPLVLRHQPGMLYRIIIDDIWDKSTWKILKCVLVDNDHGSKIITSTRKMDVAELCCNSDGANGTIYELQPLSVVDSEQLLFCKVFHDERCPLQLKDISQKILKRCGGLPLAIVTVASLFANKQTQREDHWNNVFSSFHLGLESNTDVKDMRWILSLSYCDMDFSLQSCFLYLSIFPEDHSIQRDDLIWRWIAEGFIHPRQNKSLFEQGESFFDELINRNLIQPIWLDVHGKAQACHVHDMIFEFITWLSTKENFVTTLNGECALSDLPKRIYRLSLKNCKDDLTILHAINTLSHVRSLVAISWQSINLEVPLSRFQVLRVLDLGDCSNHKIDDISRLVHLRYLRLRGIHCTKLPRGVGNLRFLQTLDIKKTRIKELPSTIVHLTQLMRLYADTWTNLPIRIGNMECLEYLSEIKVSMHTSLMKELSNLPKLRVLEVMLCAWDKSKEKPFLDYLSNMKNLEALHIFAPGMSLDFMLDVDWALQALHKFTVCVRRKSEQIFDLNPSSVWAEFSPLSTFPRWINTSLTKLSNLSIMVRVLRQEDLEVLGDLPALHSLDLQVIDVVDKRLVIVGHNGSNGQATAFQFLAIFNFTCPAMVLVFRYGAMQRLQMLSLCFRLKDTNFFHNGFELGLDNLTSLKAVDFGIDCRYARLWEVQGAEVALRNATNLNPNHPTLNLSKHFERLMLWDGMEEIPELEIFQEENAGLAKIGPCGGNRGRPYDIKVAPHHLESIKVCSDMAVHSFEFTYSDYNGNRHTAGPWGGYGGSDVHMIQLEPSEFLMEVSGTFGRFQRSLNVITSLTFVTNVHSYGPYGQKEGTSFHMPVHSSGCIVGFFGCAGWYVDAIGIYVNPKQQTVNDKAKIGIVKIGACGGNGGKVHDIKVPSVRLESVAFYSYNVIHSLRFSYIDHYGEHHVAGPWGGDGGGNHMIQFGPSEFVTRVSGTIGSYNTPSDVITSIMLITNIGNYGPFGQEKGIPFQFAIQGNGSIVGFFVRAEVYINAIGVYESSWVGTRNDEAKAGLTKIGPFGRRGGIPCDIKVVPYHLQSITISSKIVINSLAFSYTSNDGQQHNVGPWGISCENKRTIQLGPSEFLIKVYGTFGQFGEFPIVMTSLTFISNTGQRYGPFGQGGGTPFYAPISGNGSIVSFFGCEGSCVDAIGFYFRPS